MIPVLPGYQALRQALENIISTTSVAQATTSLTNTQSTVFTITTTSTSGAQLMTLPYFSLYMTSVSAANIFPDGANVTMSSWVVIPFINDETNSTTGSCVAKIYVQNNTGSTQTLIIRTQSFSIINSISTGGAN